MIGDEHRRRSGFGATALTSFRIAIGESHRVVEPPAAEQRRRGRKPIDVATEQRGHASRRQGALLESRHGERRARHQCQSSDAAEDATADFDKVDGARLTLDDPLRSGERRGRQLVLARQIVRAAERQNAERGLGACQALRDDVDRPIATSGDNEGIAVMRCCQREPGRVRGVARFDELRCITTRQLDNNRLAPRLPSGGRRRRRDSRTRAPSRTLRRARSIA